MEAINNEEKQTKALLDNLFEEVRAFRYAKEVRALFDYCRRMQHLSAYNAALVYTQQPGTQLVLSAKQWYHEGRLVKPNSRPLIILLPFGPVGFVYDIADTVPMLGKDSDYIWEQLLDKYINHPYALKHHDLIGFGPELENLTYNLPFFGIKYEMMKAGSSLGANIQVYYNSPIDVPIRKRNNTENLKYSSYFWLGVNDNAGVTEELAALVHELGHLFCHHPYIDNSWWKPRKLSENSREFEAESTAWLICSRLGFDSRSVEYLSQYKDDEEIPPVSFESIFRAANQVENMVKQRLSYKDGYLYKYDKDFKRMADEKAATIKAKE